MVNPCLRAATGGRTPRGCRFTVTLALVLLLGSSTGHPSSLHLAAFTTPWSDSLPPALAGVALLAVAWRQSTLLRQRRKLHAAQEALRASEQRWQFALDGAGDGVWDWNLETGQVFFSHRWKTMLGYGADEIGDVLEEWKSRLHAEDLERVLAAVEAHLAGRTLSYSSEHRVRCRDGSYRWVLDRGRVVCRDAGGRPQRVMGTQTDVTARREMENALRESERLLRESQAAARIGSYCEDVIAGTWSGSPELYEVLGVPSDHHGTVESWCSLVHPDCRQEMVDYLQRVQEAGGRFDRVYRIVRPSDGAVRWVHGLGLVEYAADGSPRRMAGTLRDVTDTVEAEQARQRLEEQAQRTRQLESLGAMAGGIAHEFNNLLAGMLGPLSVARAGVPPRSDEAELLADVEWAIRMAEERARQLLVFSKGGTPVKVRTSLEALLRDAARRATAPCELSLAQGLRAVDADVGQITQLLTGLLANAAQAAPLAGPIEIVAENVEDAAGAWVQVRVRDTGTGIAEADLPRIFEPFFSTRPGGRGLGLAAAHAIVCAHGGSISAESVAGQGTTITFRLPAMTAALEHAAAAPGPPKAPAAKGTLPRVLLIEDDAGVRSAMTRMLKHLGYEVEAVEDGRAGVTAYQRARDNGARFDVVIADLTIPGGMGGREAVAALHGIDPTVRAIVASGYSDDPVLSHPAEFGFAGVIQKPCDMATLGRVVREAMA